MTPRRLISERILPFLVLAAVFTAAILVALPAAVAAEGPFVTTVPIDLNAVPSQAGQGPGTFFWNLFVTVGPVALLAPLAKRFTDLKIRGRVADAKLPYAAAVVGVVMLAVIWGVLLMLAEAAAKLGITENYSPNVVFPGGFGAAAASMFAAATAATFWNEATKERHPARTNTLEQAQRRRDEIAHEDAYLGRNAGITYGEDLSYRGVPVRRDTSDGRDGFVSVRLVGLLAAAGLVAALVLGPVGCTPITPAEKRIFAGKAASDRELVENLRREDLVREAQGKERVPAFFLDHAESDAEFSSGVDDWASGRAPLIAPE